MHTCSCLFVDFCTSRGTCTFRGAEQAGLVLSRLNRNGFLPVERIGTDVYEVVHVQDLFERRGNCPPANSQCLEDILV
jgi:hypothetical protein